MENNRYFVLNDQPPQEGCYHILVGKTPEPVVMTSFDKPEYDYDFFVDKIQEISDNLVYDSEDDMYFAQVAGEILTGVKELINRIGSLEEERFNG